MPSVRHVSNLGRSSCIAAWAASKPKMVHSAALHQNLETLSPFIVNKLYLICYLDFIITEWCLWDHAEMLRMLSMQSGWCKACIGLHELELCNSKSFDAPVKPSSKFASPRKKWMVSASLLAPRFLIRFGAYPTHVHFSIAFCFKYEKQRSLSAPIFVHSNSLTMWPQTLSSRAL